MSLGAYEIGEGLQKQFKRTTVSGGPLRGARYLEVSWEDLRKAAKQYRADPRFNQFAKRVMSERALGKEEALGAAPGSPEPETWKQYFKQLGRSWLSWIISKMRLRLGLTIFLLILCAIILSRPLFYVVLAKSIALSVRLFLRRSLGMLALVVDALLDEVADSLEASLLTQPPPQSTTGPAMQMPMPPFDMAAPRAFHDFLVHGLFTILGIILGRRFPRAARFDRNAPPTRLRV